MKKSINKTEQVIKYIISRLNGTAIRTQLLKFLYLIDLEHRKLTGTPITDLQYKWWFHGPYDKKFKSYLKRLENKGLIKEERQKGIMDPDKEYFIYEDIEDKTISFSISNMEKEIIDTIITEYRRFQLKDLLEEIIYETKPMLKALEKGTVKEPLDMDCVNNEYEKDINKLNIYCQDFNFASFTIPNAIPV